MPLLTKLETSFDFGCYNYAAPDGAGNEIRNIRFNRESHEPREN
jgi:hypothetical protein